VCSVKRSSQGLMAIVLHLFGFVALSKLRPSCGTMFSMLTSYETLDACSTSVYNCMTFIVCALSVQHKTGDNFTRPWSHGGNVAQVMAATALGQLDCSVTGVPVEGKLARIRKGDGHSKRKDMVCIVTNQLSSLILLYVIQYCCPSLRLQTSVCALIRATSSTRCNG
jgi:hypothetical protein